MSATVEFPHPGIETWTNQHGIKIFQLHYSADPEKGAGEKIFVSEIKKYLSPWAKSQYDGMTDKAAYLQEFEIDFSAKLGSLLYQLNEEATLEKSFPIPHGWTRYFGLDPHPVVPHASLWVAVDPWGDAWAYRELWPSKIYGNPGNVPEDDNRVTIKDYVETLHWLESSENPENSGKEEQNYKRVIDYAARSFGQGMNDEDPTDNFQRRFEQCAQDIGWFLGFEDCKKDNEVGISLVNEWLKPRDVEQKSGDFKPKSRLHIFQDKCPELIHQLKNNRYQQLTPILAERSDPLGKPVEKRNHLTAIIKYLCMAGLEYVAPPSRSSQSTWKPITKGVAY